MSEKKPAMICQTCGLVMIHHADKPVDPWDAEAARRMDPKLGLLIEEVHTCPGCGCCSSRPG